ncbi:MAG: radical SAM protein [Geobacteraceae bacterium]|nr:radical SAM protein [Geobacteraceae bacterium]
MKPLIVPFFIAHQGCPHRCVFCDQVKISGAAEDIPTPAGMLARIAAYRDSGGGRSLEAAFFGGTFTSLPKYLQERLLGPLQPLLETGEIASVRVSTRPDAVDSRTVEFLGEMGVRTVELGIQSLDDAVLARAGRGHTARDGENACRLLADAGFRVGAQLMPGLPGDTPEAALATLRRTLALRPDFLRIYPTLVLAGTELEAMYQGGDYTPLPLREAVALCKVMLLDALRASVPVVRIGLQATDELRAGAAVVAGPWHPAFRQLVEGELFFDLISLLTAGSPPERPVTLFCAPPRLSDLVGQRRENLIRLSRERWIEVAAIRADPRLSPLELRVSAEHFERSGSLLDLNYSGGH